MRIVLIFVRFCNSLTNRLIDKVTALIWATAAGGGYVDVVEALDVVI
jgi:hypothetical protein